MRREQGVLPGRRRSNGPDERGAVAVLTALTVAFVLLPICALTVDISMTWMRRGELQAQTDAATLAAAAGLPVAKVGPTAASTQLVAAKYAAYHVVCNPLAGQRDLGVTCSSALTPQSPSLDALAKQMIANGSQMSEGAAFPDTTTAPAIWFPTTTEVELISATYHVDRIFGGVVGSEGSDQVKRARAKVSSPGQMLPIALATDSTTVDGGGGCYLPQLNTAKDGISNIGDLNLSTISGTSLPIVSLGLGSTDATGGVLTAYPQRPGLPTSPFPLTAPDDVAAGIGLDYLAVFPASPLVDQQTSLALPEGRAVKISVSGSGWFEAATLAGGSTSAAGGSGTRRLHWFKADASTYVRGDSTELGSVGLATGFDVPAAVSNSPGLWYVTLTIRPNGGQVRWAPAGEALPVTIVDADEAPTRLDLGVGGGCARYLDSPRVDTSGMVTDGTLQANILNGMDHTFVRHPAASLARCNGYVGVDGSVADAGAAGPVPNCVSVTSNVARGLEITTGWLGTPPGASGSVVGRLDCTFRLDAGHPNCRPGRTFELWGRTFNNDRLDDFIVPAGTLAPKAFSHDSYTGDGLPLISPENGRLSAEIYYSPRLFWAPVVSMVGGVWDKYPTHAQYRIVAFRPVFITQSQGEGVLHDYNWCIGNGVAGVSNRTLNPYFAEYRSGFDHAATAPGDFTGVYLNGIVRGRTDSGLCLDDAGYAFVSEPSRLKGLRFQTMAPRTMPAVPDDYTGPMTDYIGTGPRITRLVR